MMRQASMRTWSLRAGLVALFAITNVSAMPSPISNLQVTLRGKKYDIDDATSVQDVHDQLELLSGVKPSQQGKIIFGGKKLSFSDALSDIGVVSGAKLNVVPSSTSSKPRKSSASASSSNSAASTGTTAAAAATAAATSTSTASTMEAEAAMKDYLQKAGVDPAKLDEMMAGMNNQEMPSMEESLNMMTDMMKSPLFQSFMNDPEKLEEARQMILNNPMLKSMMGSMPGFEDLLNDPVAFKEAMQAAASFYQNMDPQQLMSMMNGMGGMGGGGGMNGLFDGTLDSSTSAKALDELDEDD